MLTIAILFILFIGAYSGYKNGMIIGLIRTIGYTITFNLAMAYYKALSEYIYLIVPYPSPFSPVENPYHYYDTELILSLDQSYYYLVSIFVILVVGWFITRLISQFLSYYTEGVTIPELVQPYNGIIGSIIGFVVNYLGVFVLLFILTTIPYSLIQDKLSESWLADTMLISTPNLSARTYQVFIEEVHEEDVKNRPIMDVEAIMNPEESNEEQEESNDE